MDTVGPMDIVSLWYITVPHATILLMVTKRTQLVPTRWEDLPRANLKEEEEADIGGGMDMFGGGDGDGGDY